MEQASVTSIQLNKSAVNLIHPEYKFTRLTKQTGGTTQTLTTAGGVEDIWDVPAKVFNYSRSYFTFTATPVAQVAGGISQLPADTLSPFLQFQVYTRGGQYMVNLNHVGRYMKIMQKPETKLQEYLDYDLGTGGSATLQGLRRNNTTAAVSPAVRYDDSAANLPYTEPAYFIAGTAAAANPVVTYHIPLSAFKNTLCAVDKDVYFGEITQIRIQWAQTTDMLFYSTGINTPATVAAAFVGNVAITNLYLYLCVEKNIAIANSVKAEALSDNGLKMIIPYIHCFKQNLTGASQTVTQRINNGHGRRLRKVLHSCFNNNETLNLTYDHNNLASVKVASFYTNIDNDRVQEFDLSCANFDDYKYLYDKELKGSVIQSSNMFYYNWFYLDDFSYLNKEQTESNNVSSGIPLGQEVKWEFVANTAGNPLNHYTFIIVERLLSIMAKDAVIIVQ